jgi:hypothetical protein
MAKKKPADVAGKLSAILWTALGYLAKKRTKRELLDAETRVDVVIEGKVGRSKICEHVVGVLRVAEDSQRASSKACDTVHLIGLLLAEMPSEEARAKFKKTVAEFHAENKRLPDLPKNAGGDGFDEWTKSTEQFLALLRSHEMTDVAGSITFEVSAETTA